MKKYRTLAGMDVHARSITVRVLVAETGETASRRFTGCPGAAEVAGWLHGFPGPVHAAYESGCTGFHLARGLRELGVDCDVIAVSTLPRSDKDRKQKCDKLDAKVVLRELASGMPSYSAVAIPDVQLEGDRELGRAWRDAVDELKAAKQQVQSLLLRQGHVYDERTPSGRRRKRWTRRFREWVGRIELETEEARRALEHYMRKVDLAQQEADAMERLVREAAMQPRNRPFVEAIGRIKGLGVASAYIARVEIGEFSRFPSGRKVSCWLGSVPSNSSSGEGEVHGKVTRAGNATLRRMLVECASTIPMWRDARKAGPGPEGLDAGVSAMAARASERMLERYRHLTGKGGKHPNKAKMAVVNELVRWIWAIGCEVESGLAPGAGR